MTTTHAVEAVGLVKRYGETTALAGADLAVAKGTIMGVLGPNGAGKTTMVRVLTTLIRADAGEARVAGYDVRREGQQVRALIGLSGQFSATDGNLTGRENLRMIGRLYQLGRAEARTRADDLIERLGLGDAADRPARGYSGGMNRRLDLAAAIIGRAPVLFLDEPTTGLDPASRRDIWELIRELVDDGTTLVLTTQYLDEADRLADRIAVIDHGVVIAEGTVEELKSRVGGDVLELRPSDPARLDDAERALSGLGPTHRVDDERSAPAIGLAYGRGPRADRAGGPGRRCAGHRADRRERSPAEPRRRLSDDDRQAPHDAHR